MDCDVLVIGSGVGGGCVALTLADTGARILIVERGERLPREPQNWDASAVFVEQRYRAHETWYDRDGKAFRPGQFYYVGGHTKFFGTAMFRFRERDFEVLEHEEGVSPAWPIRYAELEPWYAQAERLFGVHGQAGEDPTEPPRSTPYPFPPIEHEPVMDELAQLFRGMGLAPFHMPSSIALHADGACIRCGTCDAFPCQIDAKGDAEICLVNPALRRPSVQLQTGSLVTRLITDDAGKRIVAAEVERNGQTEQIHARLFVLSAGAVNSAVILLRSANGAHPHGLANASGAVGRYFMNHNCTALMALMPLRVNRTHFPKTLTLNDFYFGGGASATPLGNLQPLGKIQEPMLRGALPLMPKALRHQLARHSCDWYVMSEDLPHVDSWVRLRPDNGIELNWRRTNLRAHRRFVGVAKRLLRDAGFPVVLSKPFGSDTPSHQCGTVRFGDDPAQAPLDPYCRAYDHDNLYVVDASFFPSCAALNPALTVAAQALRVGAHLKTRLSQF
ncbi:MAG TPA: GMC family oxidoreductase [Burkholderiales bacterium]|nr:GMC family oxidoreductase [Burkholderiales bacterium]